MKKLVSPIRTHVAIKSKAVLDTYRLLRLVYELWATKGPKPSKSGVESYES